MAIFEPYYKDLSVISVGEEQPRAYFIPYADAETASRLDRTKSPYFKSLCGEWNFRYYESVTDVTDDFTTEEYFDSEYEFTDTITVPRSWQTVLGKGYDKPQYANVQYPFPVDPPHIPDENPCAVYTRDFYLSEAFASRKLYLNFEGVDSCYYVWVNGKFIGYSTVSHSTSEFDVSGAAVAGRNTIAVLVVKWCAQSYLEDQDKYRNSGIFREVYLLARAENHIRDLYVRQNVADDLKSAALTPEIAMNGKADVSYTLFAPDGTLVSEGVCGDNTVISLENPVLWNDEKPELYKLILVCGDEVIYQNIAVKKIKIVGKIFYLNGKKIKIRGVNRHDSHPVLGSTAPYEHFVRDLKILKQNNVNSIRTSHYPNDPRMIELCEIYGFYMIDETDLETHGMIECGGAGSALSNHEDWKDAYVYRAQKMFERDKNRGCVVMWSLGNESGCGENHRHMRKYIRSRMPDAVIHYEGERNEQGYDDVVDVRSEMYTAPKDCLAYIKDKDPKKNKPFYLCEYLHAMGNGPGGIKEYIDLIRAEDAFLGANVWEYCDHSVLTYGPNGEKRYTYGGDFGEIPHDGNFCVDGLVYPDRTLSNGMRAIKNAYMPAEITLTDPENGEIEIRSWRYFESLADVDVMWNVECDGKIVKSGRIAALPLAAKRSRKYQLCKMTDFTADGEYFLNVRLVYNTDTPYYEAGYEMGFRQFELGTICSDAPVLAADFRQNVECVEDEQYVEISSGELCVLFEKASGKIASIVHDGREMLAAPISLNLWRAPTDNDQPQKGDWINNHRLHRLEQKVYDCKIAETTDDHVTLFIDLALSAPSKLPAVKVKETITVSNDGSISFEFDVERSDKIWILPRFGLEIVMPEENERVEYFGFGPYEAYSDHKYQSRVGYFHTTATDNFEHYIYPQENSSHCDTRRAFVGTLTGHGLMIEKLYEAENFSFNAQHFSAMDLTQANHDYELVARKETYVYADMRMNGIGTGSCGPMAFEPYRFTEKTFHCGIVLRPAQIQ